MKKEDIKSAYSESTDGFHHSVMNALYHLDDKATAKHRTKKKIMKVALVFAVAAAVGTTTVASATGFFGLFTKPVGNYGVNISTDNSTAPEDEPERAYNCNIKADYLPEGFVPRSGPGYVISHLNDNYYSDCWYFMAFAYKSETYNRTEGYIIDTEETEFNGHRAVITTKKPSENSDRISYVVTEYFDDEKIVLRFQFIGLTDAKKYFEPDHDEMLKIVNGISIEMLDKDVYIDHGSYGGGSPVSDYDTYDLVQEGAGENCVVGKSYTDTVADYDGEETQLTYKVVSITEQDTAGELSKEDFYEAGVGISLYDKFFDENGKFISEYTVDELDKLGDGISSLSQTHKRTYTKKFYCVKLELTADKDIENICRVLSTDAFGISSEGELFRYTDNGQIDPIADTGVNNEKIGIKKGETIVIYSGFVTDTDVENDVRFVIKTANGIEDTAKLSLFEITK